MFLFFSLSLLTQPSFILFVSFTPFCSSSTKFTHLCGHCLKGLCNFNEVFCMSFCFQSLQIVG